MIPEASPIEIVFEGTVIMSKAGTFIDNGNERYLLDKTDLPRWREIRVTGTVYGDRINVKNWEPLHQSLEEIQKKAKKLHNNLLP
jgi:hypothetical protein